MLWFLQLDPKQLMVPMVSCHGLRGVGCGCGLVPCRNSNCRLSCGDVLPTPLWVSSWGSESDRWEELLMVSPWHWEWGASYSSLEGNPTNVRGKQKERRTNVATGFVFEMPHSTMGSEISQISLTALALPHIYLQTDHRATSLNQEVAIW